MPTRSDLGLSEDLRARIRSLPNDPGVYLFKDRRRRVIYIGKAKDLRARVRSYFTRESSIDPRTRHLRREITSLDAAHLRSGATIDILRTCAVE